MNYRALGYTQHKPTEPGIYLIGCEPARGHDAPLNAQQGWDVAILYFYTNGGYYSQREGHWRVKSLRGLEYTWRRGMWIKGPLMPSGAERKNPESES